MGELRCAHIFITHLPYRWYSFSLPLLLFLMLQLILSSM